MGLVFIVPAESVLAAPAQGGNACWYWNHCVHGDWSGGVGGRIGRRRIVGRDHLPILWQLMEEAGKGLRMHQPVFNGDGEEFF